MVQRYIQYIYTYLHYYADALILVGTPGTPALIRWCRQRTGVIRIVRADAGRTGRIWWILAYVECVVAYVHYEDISWRWDVELKSKALIISQNQLIMGQVNLYICIGHFSPLAIYTAYSIVTKCVCPAII